MRDAGKAIFYLSFLKNSKASGAPPRTPLGELTTLPQTPSRVGRAPLPTPLPFGASAPRFLRGAFGAYFLYLSGPPPF